MARRICLDENGLRISREGVDVLTASPGNLMFRSDATHVPRWDTDSLVGIPRVSPDEGAVHSFGRTFATIPMVTWSRHQSGTVVNGIGSVVNSVWAQNFYTFSWIIKIERHRILFNSPTNSVLYFKVWDFEK